MPQMAPMWWTTLMFMFSGSLLVFTFLNFFITLPKLQYFKKKIFTFKLNWKW